MRVKSDLSQRAFIFLLWPFLSFLLSIATFKNKASKIIIVAFLGLYGYTLINTQWATDLYSNYLLLQNYANSSDSYFNLVFSNFFKDQKSLDIVQKSLVYFVSRFTSNEGILFSIYAIVFGILFIICLSELFTSYKEGSGNHNSYITFLMIVTLIPISAIGNFRFYSAVWIFFYGLLKYSNSKENKYILISALASAMHFSLIIASIILITYKILGNREKLYLSLAVISFFIPPMLSQYILKYAGHFGFALEDKAYTYLDYDYIQKISSTSRSWFIILKSQLLNMYIYIVLLISYYKSKSKNSNYNNLFSVSLIFLIFSNLSKSVPSLGPRYQLIFNLISLTCILKYYNITNSNRLTFVSILALVTLAFQSAIILRQASESINLWILFPTPFPVIGDPISIYNFILGG